MPPSCIRPEVRLRMINIFFVVIVVRKCIMACSGSLRGVTRGVQGGHNSPGAESLWGAELPNHCGERRKIPTMSQVLSSMQYICFRKTSVSNMGV